MQETSLYIPVNGFFESLEFTSRRSRPLRYRGGARRRAAVLVICELKTAVHLETRPASVDRAAACDEVWLAARMSARGKAASTTAAFGRFAAARFGFWPSRQGRGRVAAQPGALPRGATRSGARG